MQPPKTVTSLRARGRGRVAVELDGLPWRTLALEPVLRAGLAVGVQLDRGRARALARELRRARALDCAGRALRRRDLSKQALDSRLERAGVAPAGRRETLETLERAGVLDERRFAAARAAALAARGYGDAWISWDLERRGVRGDAAAEALAALDPEGERALRVAAARARGDRGAVARLLARRGFGEDAVEAAGGGNRGGGGAASLG